MTTFSTNAHGAYKKKKKTTHQRCEIFFKTDDGQPWRLNDMPFFIPIYNGEVEKIVLLTSRQSTKTTYLRNIAGLRSMDFKGNAALYIAPTNNQVGDFSRKKLDRIFDYTPELRNLFIRKNCTWNVLLKEFSTRATITLRSTGGAQGADRVRGNTANDIYLDEFQNLLEEDIPVIEECAATFDGKDGRKKAFYVYTGTPLSSQNPLQRQYHMSRQWQWHMQCPHCSIAAPDGTLSKGWQRPIGLEHLDTRKDFLFCTNCGRNLYRKRGTPKKFDPEEYDDIYGRNLPFGRWCSHNPNGVFDGYRVVRLMMPWSRWRTKMGDGILDRMESWPERQFKNEVMALPHDSGTMPITERVVRALSTDYRLPQTDEQVRKIAEEHRGHIKYAGLDWAMEFKKAGKKGSVDTTASYTIFSVYALVGQKLKLIFAHRFIGVGSNDGDYIRERVRDWMNLFEVKRIGCDYGVGYHNDLWLMKQFGPNKVSIFRYKQGAQNSQSVFDRNSMVWNVPRTRTLDQLCLDLAQGKFILPKYEEAKTYTDDWLRLTIEISEATRSVQYGRLGTDDFAHCTNYANLAKRLDFGEGDFAHSMMTAGVNGADHQDAMMEHYATEDVDPYVGVDYRTAGYNDLGVFYNQ